MLATRLLRPSMMVTCNHQFVPFQRMFKGKEEDGFKYRTPKMRLRCVQPIPPPGMSLKMAEGWTAEKFCKKIGGDCDEHYDKFEKAEEVITLTSVSKHCITALGPNERTWYPHSPAQVHLK